MYTKTNLGFQEDFYWYFCLYMFDVYDIAINAINVLFLFSYIPIEDVVFYYCMVCYCLANIRDSSVKVLTNLNLLE